MTDDSDLDPTLAPLAARLRSLPLSAWEPGPSPPPLAVRLAPPRRRIALRPVVALACALALLALGAVAGALIAGLPERGTTELALSPVGGRDPAAQGRVTLRGQRVNLHINGLRATRRDQFYELWLLGEDKRLVALGSFRVGADGDASMRLPLPVDPKRYAYFDISLQPDNGDPNHSGLSVLRGPTKTS